MATLYVDYENGNDSNDGTSFANRKKTLNSATTASSAGDTIRVMASPDPTLVGNGSVVSRPAHGYYQSISSVSYSTTTGSTQITINSHGYSNGDTICIYANTNGRDLDGVYEISNVTTNTFTLDGYTASSSTTGNGGYVYNWTAKRVWLSSAVTQTIASTGSRSSSWTASTNVTCTLRSNTSTNSSAMYWIEHAYSDEIAIASGFTTGKAAYYTLPSTLDLSGYQQLSFYIRQSSGSVSITGNYSLRLCTDTSGNTSVHTFTVPMGGTSGGYLNYWRPVTIDLGTNLNSSIRSIALYVDSDFGAQTILLNNIIACKSSSSADSLTLNSLIGRNTSSNNEWYPIESIVGQRVLINTTVYNQNLINGINYSCYGVYFADTAGTYSFYKRECIITSIDNPATFSSSQAQTILKSGTSSASISISGGWNRTDMSTQTTNGISFFDSSNMFGYGLDIGSYSYLNFENLGFVRYYIGIRVSGGSYLSFKNIHVSCCSDYNAYLSQCNYFKDLNIISTSHRSTKYSIEIASCASDDTSGSSGYDRNLTAIGSPGSGIRILSTSNYKFGDIKVAYSKAISVHVFSSSNNTIGNVHQLYGATLSSSTKGLNFVSASNNKVGIATFNHVWYGIDSSNSVNNKLEGLYYSAENYTYYNQNNTGYSTYQFNSSTTILEGTQDQSHYLNNSTLYLKDCEITSASEYSVYSGSTLYSKNHDNVSGNYLTAYAYGKITSDTTTRHTSSGYSWKVTLTSSNAVQNSSPKWLVSKVAVNANSQLTIGVYVYRTGTGITGGIIIPGGEISGIDSDVSSYTSGSSGAWELVTVTATPTEDGIVPVYLEAYYVSNTAHVLYFDDMSISQA